MGLIRGDALSKKRHRIFEESFHQNVESKLVEIQLELQGLKNNENEETNSKYINMFDLNLSDMNIKNLEAYLKEKQLEVVDKRQVGGCLWIVGGKEFENLLLPLKKFNYVFRFTERGSRSTKRRPSWFLVRKRMTESEY